MAVCCPIPHGDFIFNGIGAAGESLKVCGERKKPADLIDCIEDGRHLNQIRSAAEAGFDLYFLVVEGQWREARNGEVEYYRRGWVRPGMSFLRVDQYLNELHYLLGVQVKLTRTARQTARAAINLHDLMQVPPGEHDSLKRFYNPLLSPMLMAKPTLRRRMLKELPGIGWERSLAAERHFGSVREAVNASVEDWVQVEGVGKGIARTVVQVMK